MDFISIPAGEFPERIAKTRTIMREKGIDLLLAFSTESEPAYVRYYSDYWPSFETAAVLISADGGETLLIGPESGTYASARSTIERIVRMIDFRESSQPAYPGSKLAGWSEVLAEFPSKRVGIAGWHLIPHPIVQNLRAALPNAEIFDADEVPRGVMQNKSEAELACLREAARLSELGFKAVLENIREGATEAQLCGIANAAMMAAGAEATGYPIWCCSGPNSTQAISRPTHRKVRKGEVIHFSIGAKVAGYSASVGRPVVLGTCSDDLKAFLQTGLDAMNMTIDLMRDGAVSGEVARKVHGWITDRGYGHTILYGPAHGCGQMECEYPFLESSSTFTLKENMAFMVDVFLADETRGFRWEDGIIVRKGAAEELSGFGRKLNILEV
jgi:Xaa-Pro aminopeptidase